METTTNSYADQVIARTFENAAKQPNDPDRIGQAAFKRADAPLIRRANILYKRAATNHLTAKAIEQEVSETAPLRALLAETEDLATKRRIQREIDGYRILSVQRPVNVSGTVGIRMEDGIRVSRHLRRKMKHDARRGTKHGDLVGNYGRLALYVLSVDDFNTALAGRHELGLSKDVQFAGSAAFVAEDATEREAA